jgi:hypothetical protein
MDKARQVPGQALAGLAAADQDALFRLLAQMVDNLQQNDG